MRWFTADLHFCHKKILGFCPERGYTSLFGTDGMHVDYIRRWNQVVDEDDTVFILGDFALGSASEMKAIVHCLKGKKVLIRGNHDHKSDHWYLAAGFTAVTNSMLTCIGGETVSLSHYPLRLNWWEQLKQLFTEPKRLKHLNKMMPRHGGWHLHGHVHSRYTQRGRQLNVGVDAWQDVLLPEIFIQKIMAEGPKNYN